MDKNKLSYYASFAAIACGILIVIAYIIGNNVSLFKLIFGVIFIVIGYFGLRQFKNK